MGDALGSKSIQFYFIQVRTLIMFIISSKKVDLTYQVMSFMSKIYPNLNNVDIEVIQKDLTEDNVFGWTLENNDQNEIEIHDDLSEKDYITTLIHELIHVDQNVRGLRDDDQREREAYDLEGKYYQLYKCLK